MLSSSDITKRFLLSQKSTLTPYQQVGLANMVEWLGSSYSTSETAYVTTTIGFKYAAMMLWCLPSMLEWADNNQLIPDKAIHFKKPVMILYQKGNYVRYLEHGAFQKYLSPVLSASFSQHMQRWPFRERQHRESLHLFCRLSSRHPRESTNDEVST